MPSPHDQSWEQLEDTLRALEREEGAIGTDRLVHELRVHQVELEMQNRELRCAQENLEASRARYADLYDRAPVGYVTLDRAGRILELNVTAAAMLAQSREHLEGVPFAAAARLRDPRAFLGHLRQGTEPEATSTELTIEAGDKRRVLLLTIGRLRSAEGETPGLPMTMTDVTGQRDLAERLARSEKLASLGTLSAGLAHEINNPLTYVITNVAHCLDGLQGVLGSLDSAKESVDPAHRGEQPITQAVAQLRELHGILQEASGGAERIRRLIRDLGKFTRSGDGAITAVDVRQVLESVVKLTENTTRHHARLVADFGPVPLVEATESQLAQVFTNLIVNAADAIEVGNADAERIDVRVFTGSRGDAIVEISDTGQGIPQEVRARIFDPFFTTKDVGSGMGLGLSICNAIVSALGGAIAVESRVGVGTIFRVSLPAATAGAPSSLSVAAAAPAPRRGKVLIIDDERAVAESIGRILRRDHDVTFEVEAGPAVERIGGGERYDVIFCDLMMPNVTGVQVYERLEAIAKDQAARIVFMTGGALSQSSREFMKRARCTTISKPFTVEAVRSIANERVRAAAK